MVLHKISKKRKKKKYIIPLPGGTLATLSAPYPMDENSWSQMFTVLNAMKPGIVIKNASIDDIPDSNNSLRIDASYENIH